MAFCDVSCRDLCPRAVALAKRTRKIQTEGRAHAWFTLHLDEAGVLFDDAVHRGETESRACSDTLRREERLEDVLQGVVVHPGAAVLDREDHEVPREQRGPVGSVGFVEADVLRGDRDVSSVTDGVTCVHAQVCEDLIHL